MCGWVCGGEGIVESIPSWGNLVEDLGGGGERGLCDGGYLATELPLLHIYAVLSI